jgi:hypothetical protein
MFSDIVNDEYDHWNPMSDNPIIPEATQVDVGDEEEEKVDDGNIGDEQEVLEVSPPLFNAKRRARVAVDKGKKPRTGTALVIQEQITKIADSASSFTSKKCNEVTVKHVMDLVVECGADYGSDEHFIATQLFVKKEQRDMFMTMPTNEIRFNWLRRMYLAKFGQ